MLRLTMPGKNVIRTAAVVILSAFAIFAPDLDGSNAYLGTRNLASLQYPSEIGLSCGAGEEPFYVNWTTIDFQEDVNNQNFTLENGVQIRFNVLEHVNGFYESFGKSNGGDLWLDGGTEVEASGLINRDGGSAPSFPSSYVTMRIEFVSQAVNGAFVSMGYINSNNRTSNAARISMLDGGNNPLPLTIATTGTVKAIDNFAYQEYPEVYVQFPGYTAAMYAQASVGAVKTINMDYSLLYFDPSLTGRLKQRLINPALNLTLCGPIPQDD